MEYIKTLIGRFLIEPNFLQTLNLCQDIINAEEKPNAEHQKDLNWVKEHTTKNLNIPFTVVETFISKNMGHALTYSVEVPIMISGRKYYKEYELIDLIIEIKRAYEVVRRIVTQIAKKYSMDIPFDRISEVQIPQIT